MVADRWLHGAMELEKRSMIKLLYFYGDDCQGDYIAVWKAGGAKVRVSHRLRRPSNDDLYENGNNRSEMTIDLEEL